MYEIWADDQLIYSDITPLETVKVINPKLTLADSAAGQLEMSLPPVNVGYETIKRMVTDITVKENGEWLWSGRVLQDSYDFWNNRKMICEGEIAFLNDSIQPPARYDVENTTIESFFYALIDQHNSQVAENRRFEKGMVTVTDGDMQDDNDAIYRYTNYETTLECMNDKLVSRLKGHLRVRHAEGRRYLDYISDDTLDTNSQVVRFGVNLMDFSKNIDMSELATAIVPRGARLEEESDVEIEGLEPYLTVKSLSDNLDDEGNVTTDPDKTWHDANTLYVKNPTAVNNFGWICAVVDWDAVTVVNNLYNKAVKYLKDEQYEKMTLEIKAVDLKYLDYNEQTIKFLSKLRCISEPHGMDHTFIVSKVEIDLSNPGNCYYTLGTDVQLSLTQAASRVNSQVQAQIDKLPSKNEILRAAELNAYQMIMGSENSYVHFIPGKDANGKDKGIKRIEITNGALYDEAADLDDDPNTDPFPDSTHRWIWTVGGLGHIQRDTYQDTWDGFNKTTGQFDDPTLNVAMTMDGSIVADRITTGRLKVYDQNNNVLYIINTETGYIQMEYAKLGPWYLNQGGNGLTDNSDAWVGPNKIACGQHGGTLIEMNGTRSGSGHGGHLSVEVNDNADWVRVFYNYIERSDDTYAKFESGSDERIKEDIEDLSFDEALSIIKNTDLLTFRYKKDSDKIKHYGVTAQRMEKECEELGIDNPFVNPLNDNLKTVDYDQFIAPLMKVVQEQQKEIEKLKAK